MGSELLIGFTTVFLAVRILSNFRWHGEILYGKESGEHKYQLVGIRTTALGFTARRLLPLKLGIPSMPLFPYQKVGHSNYNPSKIAFLCVVGDRFPVVAHYPVAYVRSLVLVCIYNICFLESPLLF